MTWFLVFLLGRIKLGVTLASFAAVLRCGTLACSWFQSSAHLRRHISLPWGCHMWQLGSSVPRSKCSHQAEGTFLLSRSRAGCAPFLPSANGMRCRAQGLSYSSSFPSESAGKALSGPSLIKESDFPHLPWLWFLLAALTYQISVLGVCSFEWRCFHDKKHRTSIQLP